MLLKCGTKNGIESGTGQKTEMSCYLLYKCVKHGIKEKNVYVSIYLKKDYQLIFIHFIYLLVY